MCMDETITKTYYLGDAEYSRLIIPTEEREKTGVFCIICRYEIRTKTAYQDWDVGNWICNNCFKIIKKGFNLK